MSHSHFARSLRTNRSHMLGVGEVLGGSESVAHQFQYSMFVSASENDMERHTGLIRGIFGRQADALIIGDSI